MAVTYIHYSGYMDANDTIDALAALAQPTRMEAFRRLAAAEPEGIAAGELARRLDIPQNTLSAHLAVLVRAGLAAGDRQGRSIIYRADLAALRNVVLFLLQDCCDGRPEICAPLIAELSPCCVPQE
ncbi:DNA-binding transcriptional ArsR family regulator [Aminobacter lissarensis]|uniref:DNA-binding transcriptional ArsR family regulator n=2 Tax=Aminobacter carboxidus TaxID=376165 RepID=A0A8E1WJU1_9HYPH|nr:DNA-binding transcriptional ArsR family regulator [Aminobacter lissarensis]